MVKKWIKNYLMNNKYEVLVFSFIILTGVIIGITTFLVANDETRRIATEAVTGVLDLSAKEEFIKADIVLNGLKSNLIFITILFIFAMTLFGKWGIYICMLIKGISLGIYTSVLFNVFGFGYGLLVNILLVLLVNIIYIPALIYICVSLYNLNFDIFKMRNGVNISSSIIKSIFEVFTGFILIFSSIILEQIMSTVMLNIYTKV